MARFNVGDHVWVLSRFGHGMHAATIRPIPWKGRFPCVLLKDEYNLEVPGFPGPYGDCGWSCKEWQLFPRFEVAPAEVAVSETEGKSSA